MDPVVIESPVGDNSVKREERRRQKERRKHDKNTARIGLQTHETLEALKLNNGNAEKIPLEKDFTTQPLGGNPKDPGAAETPSAGDNSEELEKRRQRKERRQAKKAARIIIQTHKTLEYSKVANANLEKILLEKDVTAQPLGGNPKMDPGSAETPLEGHAMDPMVIERPVGDNSEKHEKQRQKKERKKQKISPEKDLTAQAPDGNPKMIPGSSETHLEGHAMDPMVIERPVGDNSEKLEKRREKKERKKGAKKAEHITIQTHSTLEDSNVANGSSEKIFLEKNLTAQLLDGSPKMDSGSAETPSEGHAKKMNETTKNEEASGNFVEGDGTNERKMKRYKTMKEETKDVTTNISSSDVKNDECLCPLNAQITSTRRRKLLVLDLNGVLADIVRPPVPEEVRRGTKSIFGQSIVKRPFYDDFLNFCFENFDVGIWSSRSSHRVSMIVDHLLGDLQGKLVFCWDMTHVTPTGFQTLDNHKKPLVFKELRKIWDNNDPSLGWKKGDYDQSNTLLLDDSPFKALLNPVHTAIFPNSYCYWQKDDNSLGPGGDLRFFLEGLLASENVQDYVEQNLYGQCAITKQNPSWGFYERVVNCVSSQLKNQNSFSRGW